MARRMEFDGVYIAEQPEDDDIKSHWDKLVISAKYDVFSFCFCFVILCLINEYLMYKCDLIEYFISLFFPFIILNMLKNLGHCSKCDAFVMFFSTSYGYFYV